MIRAVPRDRSLKELLSQASQEDLEVIADIITDNGNGRIALDRTVKELIIARKEEENLTQIADVLAKEIQSFGSNSFTSLFSSSTTSYVEIAKSAAEKLDAKFNGNEDVYAYEEYVIAFAQKIFEEQEKAKASVDSGNATKALDIPTMARAVFENAATTSSIFTKMSASSLLGIQAFAASKMLASSGAISAATLMGSRAIIGTNPLLLAAGGGGSLAFEAAGPAYRITIPATMMVGHIRRKRCKADIAALKEEISQCL